MQKKLLKHFFSEKTTIADSLSVPYQRAFDIRPKVCKQNALLVFVNEMFCYENSQKLTRRSCARLLVETFCKRKN